MSFPAPPPQTRRTAPATRPAPTRAPASRSEAARGEQRDPYFDNAKYLAIVLVAMGHSWEPLPDGGRIVQTLYTFVYAFHMPVFIVVAGYFSRSYDPRPARAWRLVATLLVPYALFEVAYTLFERALRTPGFPLSPADPYWLLWFLPALFIWRLTTPVWQAVRWPVPIALAIAALATMSVGIGDDLQLARVLQFLPFYVLGLTLRPRHFELLRGRRVRAGALVTAAAGLVVAYWAVPRMNGAWFFHNADARTLGAPPWAGAVMTLVLFGCAVVLGACFLAWVPRRRLWMTALGAGTIYGYLLHGFFVRGAKYLGWYGDIAFVATPAGRVAVTVAAAVLVTLLCTPPVRRALRFAVEPRLEWLLRRDLREPVRPG